MEISQPGVILFTHDYEACVAFYRDRLGLAVTQEKDSLTKFAFGPAYLMVERGGPPAESERTRAQNPTVLRFDVADVQAAADELIGKGVEVEVRALPWGVIGVFLDPDGNRCELKNFG
jgi:lactoylglutathione lyase